MHWLVHTSFGQWMGSCLVHDCTEARFGCLWLNTQIHMSIFAPLSMYWSKYLFLASSTYICYFGECVWTICVGMNEDLPALAWAYIWWTVKNLYRLFTQSLRYRMANRLKMLKNIRMKAPRSWNYSKCCVHTDRHIHTQIVQGRRGEELPFVFKTSAFQSNHISALPPGAIIKVSVFRRFAVTAWALGIRTWMTTHL